MIRLAKETGWGYGRILGELRTLRIHCISQSTIKNILKEEGIKPSPKRGPGTWDEFLKVHVETLWQVEFFSKMIWTPTGLRQAFVLAFIHIGTRREVCSPYSFKPDAKWMVSQAHAFIEQVREADLRIECRGCRLLDQPRSTQRHQSMGARDIASPDIPSRPGRSR